MSDLPDAPWIVESWWSGGDPDYKETPYERCGPEDFLEGADSEYGWRILAWELNVDADSIEEDSLWQDIWRALNLKERKRMCKGFQQWHYDDAVELYNDYYREWRQ